MLILSPSSRGNALGRAISLADLASAFTTDVSVWAYDDGPLWRGAKRSSVKVRRITGRSRLFSSALSRSEPPLLWVVKPLPRAWSLARRIKIEMPDAQLVVDVDDDDEGLSREFVRSSLLNRLRVLPSSPLAPRRIASIKRQAFGMMDGLTYASETVRAALELEMFQPSLFVPHPRREQPRAAEDHGKSSRKWFDVGFLGTARSHKGVSTIADIIGSSARMRLHVFAGSEDTWKELPSERVIEHDPNDSLRAIYGQVDAVLLPQRRSPAANVQLPAKLLDAMTHGVPVLASPTDAITEVGGSVVTYVEDWSDTQAVHNLLESVINHKLPLGGFAWERFQTQLSLERQVEGARQFFERLSETRL